VKSNIGHLEAAAGIASVIKVVLALQHEQIPPSLHFEQPSPHIDWQRSPVRVATALTRWPDRSGPKLAGVSSFGFSGTNAHLVLGEAPVRPPVPDAAAEPQLMGLSATGPEALRELAARYAEFLERTAEPLADVAWTANTGRSHRTHRIAVIG
jgi:acyl transferase domain-containing protein